MNRRLFLLALILATAACSSQPTAQNRAELQGQPPHWDQIAAATEMAQVKNGFLIMMR
ncbi:MAG: hypothetical protein ACK5QI_05170 [Alphaproteobacteria bacterium]